MARGAAGGLAKGLESGFNIGMRAIDQQRKQDEFSEEKKLRERALRLKEMEFELEKGAGDVFGQVLKAEQEETQSRGQASQVLSAMFDTAKKPKSMRDVDTLAAVLKDQGVEVAPNVVDVFKKASTEELMPILSQASNQFVDDPDQNMQTLGKTLSNPMAFNQMLSTLNNSALAAEKGKEIGKAPPRASEEDKRSKLVAQIERRRDAYMKVADAFPTTKHGQAAFLRAKEMQDRIDKVSGAGGDRSPFFKEVSLEDGSIVSFDTRGNKFIDPATNTVITDAKRLRGAKYSPSVQGALSTAKSAGQERGQQLATQPQAKLRVDTVTDELAGLRKALVELHDHPGLNNITGPIAGRTPNITPSATTAQAKLDSIRSRIFVSALQSMREASKTGGAVGNVSDREGDKLENTMAALAQAQGTKDFRSELNKAMEKLDLSMERIRRAYTETYGDDPAPNGGSAKNNQSKPSVPEGVTKAKALKDILDANPGAKAGDPDVQEMLRSMGF